MKKFYIYSVISLIVCAFASSCSKDKEEVDTTKPVIELNEPEDGDELQIGANIHFECDFSDNVKLGSYMVEIHNNFDGHSHKAAATRASEGEQPLYLKKSFDLSGMRNAHVHHHDIFIPENTKPGTYHLMVYCTDAAGNQSVVAREVVLSHDAPEHEHED